MPKTLMVVVAHPDDEGLGVSGTMARARKAGDNVVVVCATRGEVGEIAAGIDATPETLGAVREQELRDAMALLDVSDVRFLDYRDSGMAGTPENEDERSLFQAELIEVSMDLSAIMQEVNPDVVITWDASGGYGHPDHVKVHETATDAFDSYKMRSGRPARLYYIALPVHLFEEMTTELRAQGIEWGNEEIRRSVLTFKRPSVTADIDVEEHMDVKREALYRHRSQMPPDRRFDRLSAELQRKLYGREYFHRADPPVAEGEAAETWIFS